MTQNGILSPKILRAYLENTLSDEERNAVEDIVSLDPFAADALEGMRASGNVDDNFSSIETIAQTVRERTGVSKKAKILPINIHWSVFAYAAAVIAVVVGIGAAFSLFKSESPTTQLAKTITEKETTKPEEPAATLPDSSNLLAANKPVADENKKEETTASPSQPPTTATILAATTTAAPPVAAAPKTEAAMKTANAGITVNAEDKNTSTSNEQAMALFNNNDFVNAEKKFDELAAKSPNYEAKFFGAVSAYINGNTTKAEKQFDLLLSDGAYVEGSKWYKANILLKKGNNNEAKEMFRSLSISSGIYKERAIKKLNELE